MFFETKTFLRVCVTRFTFYLERRNNLMKQNKLLGVLAIALSLAITACGGAGGKSSKHVHTFDETKWEYNDTQHWHPATCEHKTQKGSAAAHTFGDPYDITQPTCDQPGSRKVKCSVCQAEVTQEIPATGHTFAKVKDAVENDSSSARRIGL